MRATDLYNVAQVFIRAKRPFVVESAPGVGKTSIVEEAARDMGYDVVTLHIPLMAPEDFGLPTFSADKTRVEFSIPTWFPTDKSVEEGRHKEHGVILFDDRNQGDSSIQKVIANIQEARTLHGHKLASGWAVAATGNRQEDRAGANRVLSHLRNRETIVELEANLDDWTKWANQHDVDPQVVAFLRFRPALLMAFDPKNEANPTPRSWHKGVANLLPVVPQNMRYECFKGAVGEGAAAEFLGFLNVYSKLPDVDMILLKPDTADIPSDPAMLYALTDLLSRKMGDAAKSDNVMQYISRPDFPTEFGALIVLNAITKDKSLMAKNQAVRDWARKNQAVLLGV